MASYFLKLDKCFPWFFIIRSFGDEFRSIFGDILSYLSSNIGNKGKTFHSYCNTDHRRNNLGVMSVKNFVVSSQVHTLILCILFIPAMLFINYKLLLVVRTSRKKKRISPDMKNTFSLKNISSCLLVVACVVVVSTPVGVYIGLRIISPETTYTLDNVNLVLICARAIALMNCAFKCLIFY